MPDAQRFSPFVAGRFSGTFLDFDNNYGTEPIDGVNSARNLILIDPGGGTPAGTIWTVNRIHQID